MRNYQSVVSGPLPRIAEDGIGSGNLSEPQGSVQVTGMEIGMVRLGGFAERLFEGLFVGIRTNTEKIIERLHRYALEQRFAKKESPEKHPGFSQCNK